MRTNGADQLLLCRRGPVAASDPLSRDALSYVLGALLTDDNIDGTPDVSIRASRALSRVMFRGAN